MNKEVKPKNQCYSCLNRKVIKWSKQSMCKRAIDRNDFNPPEADVKGRRLRLYSFPGSYDPKYQLELCKGFESDEPKKKLHIIDITL